ncbi:hypothetical protein Tco_1318694 [Tanacetum coccineum]
MVHNYYLEKLRSAQLQKEVNGKPSMIDPARLPNTANGCKPKPRNWQASMSSRNTSARLNPRASTQNKDAKSHKTTKRYMPVAKSSASKKPERQILKGHRFSNKKTTTVPKKTMNTRSCLRWKPTGRIFNNVRLRWIPTGKLFNSCTGKVDSEPTHVSIVDIPHIHASKQTLDLSTGISFNGQKQQRIDLNAYALYNEKQENLRVWDDYMFTTIKVVSRHEDTQLYGAILPKELTNEDIRNSESYKEYYAIASGAEPPKTKASVKKKQVGSDKTMTPPKGKRLKTSVKTAKPAKKTKKKQPAKYVFDD